ncbi:sigma-70 family RNA polymerase sigma factor [Arcticibacter tournemirensis]|uniref:Sigma-70 family RNA polymerase sigma factor n=2 Tax=Pseudomonadati TaxID=3379134 RepID=A0A4Q0M460_9SPHI|nr:sigma-70 family RNA polymerase sigma factor [Arcticibacter tournemirensis]RXF67603.1 sigma-70 family RNA polymerase sigma factor [Arcticibacter tournemirensis]
MNSLPPDKNRQLQEASSEEYDLLFRKFYKFAYATALFLLKDEEETEDLVQGFFIDLWEKQKYLDLNDDIKGYLYRSIRNRALNHIRDKETERRRQEAFHLHADQHLERKEEEKDEYLRRLKEAMYELPVQRREAIQMVYLNDKKYQEAADVMGISINSLKTHLKIGLKNLRSRMKGQADTYR